MKKISIILIPLVMLAIIGGLVGYLFAGDSSSGNPPPDSNGQSGGDFDTAYKQSIEERLESGDSPITATPPPAPINTKLSFTAAQQREIIALVDNYVSLYNTYGYDDYGNIYALGDYSTITMQNALLGYIDALESQTKNNFYRQSTTNITTAVLSSGDDKFHVRASISGIAVDTQNNAQSSHPFSANVILITENDRWYVESINLITQ